MRIPSTELCEQDVVHIRRVLVPRGKYSRDEVIVAFADVETRDRIASYARNLGDFIENGKPTATFRHEIPTHLGGVHKALMQYGYALSVKYGKGFKRNVRFDDAALTLCVDILIPGGDGKWVTVDYDTALNDRKAADRWNIRQRAGSLSSLKPGSGDQEANPSSQQTPAPSSSQPSCSTPGNQRSEP